MKKILNNPLSIALIGIALLVTIAWAVAWQDYGAFSGDIEDTDDWLIRDISDTPPANGTIKRLPWSGLKTQIGNGADYWVGSAQAYLSNEIVVNDEASLYNALSDVNRFIEQGDADPEAGVDETTAGVQKIFGNNTTQGGATEWHNPASDKTNEEYWRCRASGDELECGPESDPDLFRFNRSGALYPTTVTADLIRTFNTSEPASVVVGQEYGADGSTWDPSGAGMTVDHFVKLVSTGPNVYVLVSDKDGNKYHAGVSIQTSTYATSDTLTATEILGGTIYITGAATMTVPAVVVGGSFTIITIGTVAVSIDPNGSDKIWMDGTVLDDGDKITNTSTTGDIAVCTYYSADGWYCATNGWTDGG